MDVDDYQRAAARTLIDKPDFVLTPEHAQVAIGMIQLGAHIGRIMEYVKKGIFHQHGFRLSELDRLIDHIENIPPIIAPLDDDAVMMIWNAIGYIGEACEVAALLEQSILHGKPLDVAELGKELGDGAWYPNALATRAGLRMSDVLAANLDKLRTRYPNGYSATDSVARVDVDEAAKKYAVDAWLRRPDADSDKCPNCGGGAVCWCVDPPINRAVPADYSANLAFDGTVLLDTEGNEPPTIFIPGTPGRLIAPDKLTTIINGHHLRLTEVEALPSDPAIRVGPYGTVPDEAAKVAELCGACLEYKDQATMTPCHCGADICAECTADGVTRCYICSDGGSVC